MQYVIKEARVTGSYEIRRDAGLFNFPCFSLDKRVDPGFSGGPVFLGEKLCGIVSGDSFGETYVATLWPLCLLEYEYPDLGSLGGKRNVGELFECGVLRSADWPGLKGRITKRYDSNQRPYAHIED